MPRASKVLSDREIDEDSNIPAEIMTLPGLKGIEINPDFLYVPASDPGGQTAKANFNLPPQMVKAASILVHSQKYPQFRTPSDVYRFAIFFALNALMVNEEDFIGILGHMKMMQALSAEQEELLTWADTIRLAEQSIQRHLQDGEDGRRRAVKHVSNLYAIADSMMKGGPHAGKSYKKKIDERFGHVMRNAGGLKKKGEGMAARSAKKDEEEGGVDE